MALRLLSPGPEGWLERLRADLAAMLEERALEEARRARLGEEIHPADLEAMDAAETELQAGIARLEAGLSAVRALGAP